MSLSPRLRHRIRLDSLVGGQDPETGAPLPGWADAFPDLTAKGGIPAEFVPLSGREFLQAAATQSEVTARVTIRWMPGVEPTMRLVHDGTAYRIAAVLPDPTGRKHLTLMVSTGEADV